MLRRAGALVQHSESVLQTEHKRALRWQEDSISISDRVPYPVIPWLNFGILIASSFLFTLFYGSDAEVTCHANRFLGRIDDREEQWIVA